MAEVSPSWTPWVAIRAQLSFSSLNISHLCLVFSLYLSASSLFALEAGLQYPAIDSQWEKTKVQLCGLGIPLSIGDACFLPRQATPTFSVFLKQENTIFNGFVS